MLASPSSRVRSIALIVAAFVLTAAGCRTTAPSETDERIGRAPENPPPPDGRVTRPDAGDPLVLTVGQTESRDGHAIRFVEVVEDSRCPVDLACVWTGRARVALTIDDARVELTVPYPGQPVEEPSATDADELTVEALGLDPYPGTAESRDRAPITLHLATRPAGS